jgi:hypothetical protein
MKHRDADVDLVGGFLDHPLQRAQLGLALLERTLAVRPDPVLVIRIPVGAVVDDKQHVRVACRGRGRRADEEVDVLGVD